MYTIDGPAGALAADTLGRGPHAVLVHGTFLNRRIFDGLRESLAGDLTTTAFDLRGHGDSAAPRDADYSLDGYAADLATVLRDGDAPATLVGWSLGAKTVLRYLDAYGTDDVARVVLVSSGLFHEVADAGPRAVPYLDFAAYRERVCTDWPALAADFVDLVAADTLDDATRQWLWQHCVDTPVHVARAHLDAKVDGGADTDFARVLAETPVPVDVFHGALDAAATPAEARATAALAGGSCVVFPESAHLAFLSEPRRFAAALRDRVLDR